MQRKSWMMNIVGAGLLAVAAVGFAQNQGVDVGRRHPNLRKSQQDCENAIAHIDAAQRDNEFEMGGHGQRAKELLVQADAELKAAAVDANHRPRG